MASLVCGSVKTPSARRLQLQSTYPRPFPASALARLLMLHDCNRRHLPHDRPQRRHPLCHVHLLFRVDAHRQDLVRLCMLACSASVWGALWPLLLWPRPRSPRCSLLPSCSRCNPWSRSACAAAATTDVCLSSSWWRRRTGLCTSLEPLVLD